MSSSSNKDTTGGDADEHEVPLPTVFTDPADVRAATELAEAERAAARRGASVVQVAGLAAVREQRRTEDRVAKWRAATDD